ncbi:MAG TPA: hypothetical protein VL442_05930 [Mucilaginibacter sp.]|jgi:hypothetical protein|nr:hypothetical protein [Mucilaginibacter sp.]
MYTKLIKQEISSFPLSFRLLQQEAILTKSCIMIGIEYLLKGNFDDYHKGSYYSSFFQLSIGFERIMKLIVISNYMMENNYSPIPENELRKRGHRLINLHEELKKTAIKYPDSNISEINKQSIDFDLLLFLDNFALSTGRYYNISNLKQETVLDPLITWQALITRIKREDFTEKIRYNVETITFQNIDIGLQLDDIVNNTGYVKDVHSFFSTQRANHFVVWHLMNLLIPLAKLLDSISMKCHESQTKSKKYDYPPFPYYGEIFDFIYLSKKQIMSKKRWHII